MNMNKIGNFLAVLRKENKMTQKELADRLNVTDKAISKWENGRCMPDASLFEPLCKILNITVSELLNGEKITQELAIATTDKLLLKTVDYSHKKIIKIKKVYFVITAFLVLIICFFMFIRDHDLVSKGENPSFMLKIYQSELKSLYIGPGYKMIKYKDQNIKFGLFIFSWDIQIPNLVPHPLTVINKDKRVLTETGSYCIENFNNGITIHTCGDSLDLTELNYKQMLETNSDDIIAINDDSININKVTFYSVDTKMPLDMKIENENYSFEIPNIKGMYYVELDTVSKKGTCRYSFKIRIT